MCFIYFMQTDAFSNAFTDATRNKQSHNYSRFVDPWALGTDEIKQANFSPSKAADSVMNHLWPQNHSMVKNDNCSSTTNDSDNSQLAEEILASALESTSSEKSGHGTVSSPLQSSMTLTQPFSLDNTHDDQTF